MGEGPARRNEKGALAGLDGALPPDYMQRAWPVNRLPLGGTVAAHWPSLAEGCRSG